MNTNIAAAEVRQSLKSSVDSWPGPVLYSVYDFALFEAQRYNAIANDDITQKLNAYYDVNPSKLDSGLKANAHKMLAEEDW
jgi:hypothetical protein